MKKSLVALAALAATGAFAQSAVTMYGVAEATVDVGYKKTTDTVNSAYTFTNATGVVAPGATSAPSQAVQKAAFRVQDGNSQGVGTSRIGWRGNEDLGGGMKANFQLEMGLRIDDGCAQSGPANCTNSGNTGGQLFGRNAWVGASGGFGEFRLGRQVLGSFGVQASSWAAGSSLGLYDSGASTAPAMGGVRFADAIKYITPNLGGFTGSVSLKAPEGSGTTSSTTAAGITSTTDTQNKTGLDLSGEYANGPIYVGMGYNKTNATVTTNNGLAGAANVITSGNSPTKAFTLGASYNLGVVQPFFNYTKQTANTNAATLNTAASSVNSGVNVQKAWSLGLKAPFGPVTLITAYGKNKITGSGSVVSTVAGVSSLASTTSLAGTVSQFQIGAQYALSKRTLLETNFGYNKNDSATAANTIGALTTGVAGVSTKVKESALNVGLRHTF